MNCHEYFCKLFELHICTLQIMWPLLFKVLRSEVRVEREIVTKGEWSDMQRCAERVRYRNIHPLRKVTNKDRVREKNKKSLSSNVRNLL